MDTIKLPSKQIQKAAFAGLVAGLLLLTVLRFFIVSESVHYHANFAVFINGERENFEGSLYYEEVQACSADKIGPRTRVHMHQPDNNVAHVHDAGATWGNLFENLGWTLGNRLISDGVEVYESDSDNELVFILNGQRTRNIANLVIGDEDRLLISYGSSETETSQQFGQVEDTAPLFNDQGDPGACQGSDEESFVDRLKRALYK